MSHLKIQAYPIFAGRGRELGVGGWGAGPELWFAAWFGMGIFLLDGYERHITYKPLLFRDSMGISLGHNWDNWDR